MGLEMVQVIVGIIGRYLEDGGTTGIFHRIPPTTLTNNMIFGSENEGGNYG
jgi:hypothetical protein